MPDPKVGWVWPPLDPDQVCSGWILEPESVTPAQEDQRRGVVRHRTIGGRGVVGRLVVGTRREGSKR